MITVKIKSFFAAGMPDDMRSQFISRNSLAVKVEAGTTVEGMLRKMPWLGLSGASDSMLVVFVNGQHQSVDYVLQSGDIIDLHTPVSGG